VAIVAPSGPVPRDRFVAGAEILGARYELVHDERLFERTGFLAGSDEARLAELQRALDDDSVTAVLCARGGYGLTRILGRLDLSRFSARPKPVVGFSDVTALLAAIARAGVVAIHGPVVTQLGELPSDDAAALIALLEDPAAPPPIEGLAHVAGPRCVVEGRLVGGNLELVRTLVGTMHQLDLEGAVLLLEDVGERPYRIDRVLTQMEAAGALRRLGGCVVGDLVGCAERDGSPPSALEVIAERLGRLDIAVVAGAPIGHGARNRAVPHGGRVRLDAAAGVLSFVDGAVS
jgi:muramoyltetrapeptide carboxypeptidase